MMWTTAVMVDVKQAPIHYLCGLKGSIYNIWYGLIGHEKCSPSGHRGHGTWCLVPSNYPFKDCTWKKAPGYCTMDTIAPWKPWPAHTGLSIQSALKHYTDTPGGSTLIHLRQYTDTPGAVHWYTWGSTLIHLGQYIYLGQYTDTPGAVH